MFAFRPLGDRDCVFLVSDPKKIVYPESCNAHPIKHDCKMMSMYCECFDQVTRSNQRSDNSPFIDSVSIMKGKWHAGRQVSVALHNRCHTTLNWEHIYLHVHFLFSKTPERLSTAIALFILCIVLNLKINWFCFMKILHFEARVPNTKI